MNNPNQPQSAPELEQSTYRTENYPEVPQEIIALFNGGYVLGPSGIGRSSVEELIWIKYLESKNNKTVFDVVEAIESRDTSRFSDFEREGYFFIDGTKVDVVSESISMTGSILALIRDYERNLRHRYDPNRIIYTEQSFVWRILERFRGEG